MRHLKLTTIKGRKHFERVVGRCAIDAFFLREGQLDEDLIYLSRQLLEANSIALDTAEHPDLRLSIQQLNVFFITLSEELFKEKD